MYASVFDATTGKNITREFRVNNYTLDGQEYPSVCALSSETFAVAWQSWWQDLSGYGVYASVFGKSSASLPSGAGGGGGGGGGDDDDEEAILGPDIFLLSSITVLAIIALAFKFKKKIK